MRMFRKHASRSHPLREIPHILTVTSGASTVSVITNSSWHDTGCGGRPCQAICRHPIADISVASYFDSPPPPPPPPSPARLHPSPSPPSFSLLPSLLSTPPVGPSPLYLSLTGISLVLFCLLVAYRPSNMRVYLRDGSAQTILRAATLR